MVIDPDEKIIILPSEYYNIGKKCDTNNYFSSLHLIIRSLPKNFTEFRNVMDILDFKFSIMGFIETLLKKGNADAIKLNGILMSISQEVPCRTGDIKRIGLLHSQHVVKGD